MRDLAFIDVETTGLDPDYHEIIEVAVARLDPRTLEIRAELDAKVRPGRPERAEPEALRLNGYTALRWADARAAGEVLQRLTPILNGCILAGHNVPFDRAFLLAAYRRASKTLPDLDYHVVDTASLAWPLVVAGLVDSLRLRVVCEHLGISNQGEHSSATDVRRTIEVYRRLMPTLEPTFLSHWSAMRGDERDIARAIVERMHEGRSEYGPWRVGDGRNYPRETLHEVMDALNYCAAELVRMRRPR